MDYQSLANIIDIARHEIVDNVCDNFIELKNQVFVMCYEEQIKSIYKHLNREYDASKVWVLVLNGTIELAKRTCDNKIVDRYGKRIFDKELLDGDGEEYICLFEKGNMIAIDVRTNKIIERNYEVI